MNKAAKPKSNDADLGPDASKFTPQQRKYFEQVDEAYGPQAERLVSASGPAVVLCLWMWHLACAFKVVLLLVSFLQSHAFV